MTDRDEQDHTHTPEGKAQAVTCAGTGGGYTFVMGKPKPAFQMYAADFYADTAMLTQAELGALVRIMCQHWRGNQMLTKEEQEGAALGPITDRLRPHIERELGRLGELRAEYEELSATRSEAGKLGGRPKAKGKQMLSKSKATRVRVKDGVRVESEEAEDTDKKYGSSRINECFEALKAANDGLVDGPVKRERQACHNLLRKMQATYPDHDPVKSVLLLITKAKADTFHGKNATSFTYLFNNLAKIINAIKQPTSQGQRPSNDPDERRRLALQAVADYHANKPDGGGGGWP